MLSMAAAGLYAAVFASCGFAAATASMKHQPRWHLLGWTFLAGLFVLLVISRLSGFEAELSSSLKSWARSSGDYGNRRSMQGLVVSGFVIVIALAAFAGLYRATRTMRGRRNYALAAALGAGFAMTALVLLRIISLHMIDRILYGPLKLNWFADIGSALLVLGGALFYVSLVRSRP